MNWVEIVSAILGLSCVFLAGRGSKYNFWVGYVYNIFLFSLFWHQHLYTGRERPLPGQRHLVPDQLETKIQ